MAYKVYRYTFPNGKYYIGKTKTSIEQRAGSNGCRYTDKTLVGRAIRKYGWINIKKEILFDNLSENEANKKERECIKQFNALDRRFGYNLTRGGDGGHSVYRVVSDETKRKIGEKNRQRLIGRKVPKERVDRMKQSLKGHTVTEETREKIRLANTGKHHSEETKRKLSEINRNRDPAIREKISQSLKKTGAERATKRKETLRRKHPEGIHLSDEHKAKLSVAMRGKKKSEETKAKMRKPKSPETVEKMRAAQRISHRARKLGMTYKEYTEQQLTKMIGGK